MTTGHAWEGLVAPGAFRDPPLQVQARGAYAAFTRPEFTSERMSPLDITDFVDRDARDRLQNLPGVAEVQILGERRYAMRIWLDRDRLAAYGLAGQDVEGAIRRLNETAKRIYPNSLGVDGLINDAIAQAAWSGAFAREEVLGGERPVQVGSRHATTISGDGGTILRDSRGERAGAHYSSVALRTSTSEGRWSLDSCPFTDILISISSVLFRVLAVSKRRQHSNCHVGRVSR